MTLRDPILGSFSEANDTLTWKECYIFKNKKSEPNLKVKKNGPQ